MRIGIDASNIRGGGGWTHLAEILAAANPGEHGIMEVRVWGSKATLGRLPVCPWLIPEHDSLLDGPLAARLYWQQQRLSERARKTCDVLFVPGGLFLGNFRPFVAMSQNLLPFADSERKRYGASWTSVRLLILRQAQLSTFRRADGVIFLTDFARSVIQSESGPLCGKQKV